MTQWNPELKAKVIEQYTDAKPTPDTSTEIIKEIADDLEVSPNGVRMVLVQAGVYVKKEASAKPSSEKKSGDGPKRISKESAIADLRAAIEAKGAPLDEDILSKMTGKAAVYILQVLKS